MAWYTVRYRPSALAALALILTEKVTPDLLPVQHGVRGILKRRQAEPEVLDILHVALESAADEVGPGPLESARGPVDLPEEAFGNSRCDLGHDGHRQSWDTRSPRCVAPASPQRRGHVS